MKWIIRAVGLTLAMSVAPALAQNSTKPDVSVPSSQNSGAGISGYPGNKNGPPAKSGTAGSSSSTSQQNTTVRNQDPSKIHGLPGNKSGPPAKQPPR